MKEGRGMTILGATGEGAALWWLIPLGVLAILGLAFAAVALFQGWFNR